MIGCGGIIARIVDSGDQAFPLTAEQGSISRHQDCHRATERDELSSQAFLCGVSMAVRAVEAFSLVRQLL